jgi:hypothetical protein
MFLDCLQRIHASSVDQTDNRNRPLRVRRTFPDDTRQGSIRASAQVVSKREKLDQLITYGKLTSKFIVRSIIHQQVVAVVAIEWGTDEAFSGLPPSVVDIRHSDIATTPKHLPCVLPT